MRENHKSYPETVSGWRSQIFCVHRDKEYGKSEKVKIMKTIKLDEIADQLMSDYKHLIPEDQQKMAKALIALAVIKTKLVIDKVEKQ